MNELKSVKLESGRTVICLFNNLGKNLVGLNKGSDSGDGEKWMRLIGNSTDRSSRAWTLT